MDVRVGRDSQGPGIQYSGLLAVNEQNQLWVLILKRHMLIDMVHRYAGKAGKTDPEMGRSKGCHIYTYSQRHSLNQYIPPNAYTRLIIQCRCFLSKPGTQEAI